jgi:hypothetical protein
MAFWIEIFGRGIFAPAAASLVIIFALRITKSEIAGRYSAGIALSAAYCVGYLLLPGWAELTPRRHWQWTFYLALIAVVLGCVASTGRPLAIQRWISFLLAALLAAWLLVPTWPDLTPPRTVWIPLLATYLLVLAATAEPLAARLPPAVFTGCCALAAACVALLIAAYVSVTYARLAGIAAAGLVGCWAASLVDRNFKALSLGLGYSLMVGGLAFVGTIEPRQPLVGILVAPAAPLMLWFFTMPALHRAGATTKIVVGLALVLSALGISIGLVAAESIAAGNDA